MTSINDSVLQFLSQVRKNPPLVHHLTNYVVMNFTANVTLATGAQPVMAHAPSELEEMVAMASVVVLNIGTLDESWVESMLLAGKAASREGKPIVLDPVGAGATKLRTKVARRMLDELDIAVVRGNAGEILALAGDAGAVRGVDSTAQAEQAMDTAKKLAATRGLVVAMTGVVDVVSGADGETYRVSNGHALMGRVTGTGCSATTVVGCFVGACDANDRTKAVASALAYYGRAGEIAAQRAEGPGTFVPHLLDALYAGDKEMNSGQFRIERAES